MSTNVAQYSSNNRFDNNSGVIMLVDIILVVEEISFTEIIILVAEDRVIEAEEDGIFLVEVIIIKLNANLHKVWSCCYAMRRLNIKAINRHIWVMVLV